MGLQRLGRDLLTEQQKQILCVDQVGGDCSTEGSGCLTGICELLALECHSLLLKEPAEGNVIPFRWFLQQKGMTFPSAEGTSGGGYYVGVTGDPGSV